MTPMTPPAPAVADVQQQDFADSARYAAAEDGVEEELAGGEPCSTAYRDKTDVVALLTG